MALNFSHRPVFPPHLSEENLVSPIRVANGYLLDGISEMNGDGYGLPWHLNLEVENPFSYGGDRFERNGSQESVSNDILDILPSDPFGMDISTTVTALTGWLEDLEVDYGGYRGNDVGTSDGSYKLFAELNIFCQAMKLQSFPGSMGVDHRYNMANGFGWCLEEKAGVGASSHNNCGSGSSVNNVLGFGNESWHVSPKSEDYTTDSGVCSGEDEGAPHGALSYALAHLSIKDLLNVERVCRSLQLAVRGDSLLWRSLHIDQPLNEKITDEVLVELANRAQGNLQSLSLVECPRITDDGLRRVLESNLKLTKLSVPGSTRISVEGIIRSLKAVKSMGARGVKHLRIGGLYGVTMKHFELLKLLLVSDSQTQQKSARKPHFYSRRNLYLSCDDDRDIDIELCPRCQNLRLVYDCPLEACQGKVHASQLCRACTLCIARCAKCGRCIDDNEYEETFCLELLCSVCLNQVAPDFEEEQDRKVGPSKSAHNVQTNSSSLHG